MERIQRKRTKGWTMPENTIYVGRPTKWGNPFKISPGGFVMLFDPRTGKWNKWSTTRKHDTNVVVELYKAWLTRKIKMPEWLPIPDISELKGKDLACWCPLDKLCHADVLIGLLTLTK